MELDSQSQYFFKPACRILLCMNHLLSLDSAPYRLFFLFRYPSVFLHHLFMYVTRSIPFQDCYWVGHRTSSVVKGRIVPVLKN